jgi:NADH:ubiquinone oxidoreductase subunit 5 (subunit L)/multisubunit Na+/H+ antiporter MnhA subunit
MLLAFLFALFVSGVLLWLIRPHNKRYAGWLSVVPPGIVTVWLLGQVGSLADGTIYTERHIWTPSLNLEITFYLDGLALIFGLIVALIGAGIALYTHYYLDKDPEQGQFYAYLFAFMASMLGLVWTDNLLMLFVFWEGTSITSYLLIGFKHKYAASRRGANTAFIVTGFGGIFMLAGSILLAQEAGTYSIQQIINTPGLMESSVFPLALGLLILGALTKSAQFPFHFWLPGAMAAPTPASAYLHSATMVKAGIYLLARLHPAFAESPYWFWPLLICGGITMVIGAVFAIGKSDLKALLAYATVSQLGILVMLLAFDSEIAAIAVVVGTIAHALYKGPLFMIAGIIDHATHTRNIHRLANLAREMPLVSAVAIVAALSMAGLPPFLGFLAKETLLEALFYAVTPELGILPWVLIGVAALSGAFFVGYSLTFIWEPFLRRTAPEDQAHVDHQPGVPIVLPALVLVIIGVIFPFTLAYPAPLFFDPASSAIAGAVVETHLTLWHGITPYLITSLIAIAVGVGLFAIRQPLRRVLNRERIDGDDLFQDVIDGLYGTARWTTRFIQDRSLATHIAVILMTAVIALLYAGTYMELGVDLQLGALPIVPHEILLIVVSIIAAAITVRTRSRLNAIISLGVVGIVVTLIFIFFSAPDLAITQLLIEVLTIVLLVLVFYRIPLQLDYLPLPRMILIRNVIVAVALGLFGFILVLINARPPYFSDISEFFMRESVPGGHGGNVVNVILVDFRAFDTMGEISVLAIAAVGGYALLRAHRLRSRRTPSEVNKEKERLLAQASQLPSSTPVSEVKPHA